MSFWSFATPVRTDNNKELCDCLIVCDPYVIIVSVKEIKIIPSGDFSVDSKRWGARAIERSSRQIYGAERAIKRGVPIKDRETNERIFFPESERMKILRIGVVFGRGEKFFLRSGVLSEGEGFVHVFDELSFPILTSELDTIMDFVHYLEEKENYIYSGHEVLSYGEEDMLGFYLSQNRSFPKEYDHIMLSDDIWDGCKKSDAYLRKKEQEKVSYVWDKIIEDFSHGQRKGELLWDTRKKNLEETLRTMNKERRFDRRVLSSSLMELIHQVALPRVKARMFLSNSGVVYVFLIGEHKEDKRDLRYKELGLRCLVARMLNESATTVVGLATNSAEGVEGYSIDLFRLEIEALTEQQKEDAKKIQKELGFFRSPVYKEVHFEEYK